MKNVVIAAVLLLGLTGYAGAAPARLVAAIVHVESGGKDHLRGRHGEWGRMQVKCQTARSVGFRGRCSDLAKASVNLRYGTRYLDIALKRARGNHCVAASLFNAGVYARPRCTSYGRKVVAAMRR
jgi:soluble lytic murein transglycosylase-like protein